MAEKQNLGVFWGQDNIYLLKYKSADSTQLVTIPLSDNHIKFDQDDEFSTATPVSAILRDALHDNIISEKSVNLCVPTQEILFRSFVIPWMPTHELQGVVAFEAKRYIPFPLDEITYCYYPIAFTENENKQIRIICIAIKKNTLEKYKQQITAAGLAINSIEPCSFSLVRTILKNNIINKNETVALLEKGEHNGYIIITDQGIPQFVRELQLRPPRTQEEQTPDPQENVLRALTEVRISIDYFLRQWAPKSINKIIILSKYEEPALMNKIQEEIGIECTFLSSSAIVKSKDVQDIDFLKAYGSSIRPNTGDPFEEFDLALTAEKRAQLKRAQFTSRINFKSLIITTAICAGIICLGLFSDKKKIKSLKTETANLKTELGIYEDADTEQMRTTIDSLKGKLEGLNDIMVYSDVSFYLSAITSLLPEHTWMQSCRINYANAQRVMTEDDNYVYLPDIEINGIISLGNATKEFTLGNKFQNTLKKHPFFSKYFKSINFETRKQQFSESDISTLFKLTLKP